MKYFAYGSNMPIKRLQARVPSASFLAVGTVVQHSLRFHKAGSDKSAKCDAFNTGADTDILWGVVFEMPSRQRPALDAAEGLGFGYDAKQVEVITTSGESHNALTYYAIKLDSTLQPFDWYLNHVLTGAREAKLPEDYIAMIKSVSCIVDRDSNRSHQEYAIHSQEH